jgi:ribosomal protein L37E
MLMAKVKVRCDGCGKMNRNELADRCSVCGTILADAARRRAAKLGSVSQGPAFNDLVETEVAAWQEYAEGRNRPGAMTRRPTEVVDEPKTSRLPWRR